MGEQIFILVDLIKNRINQNYQAIKENEEVIKKHSSTAKCRKWIRNHFEKQ